MPTIEVIRSQPPELGDCRHPLCRQRIEWVRTVATGKRMPVNHPLLVERVYERAGERVPVTVIDASRSHFATCVGAKDFRKPKRRT